MKPERGGNVDWMMYIFLVFAASIDNLGVGIAFGMRKVNISIKANLVIAILSFFVTWLAATLGDKIKDYLNVEIAESIGAIIIIAVGLWVFLQLLFETYKTKTPLDSLQLFTTRTYIGPNEIIRKPELADIDSSRDIDYWEAMILGIALSINAVACGLDVGLLGLSTFSVAAIVAIFSYITIAVGAFLGQKYSTELMGNKATLLSGVLMIVIGVHQLIS